MTIEETLLTLAAEVAGGDISGERRREIDLLESKLRLNDAQTTFEMVQQAGAAWMGDSIQEGLDVVEAAMEADRLHREARVEDSGFLASMTQILPDVGTILKRHERKDSPAATTARTAWNEAETGVGDVLKSVWIPATGGPNASTGQRIAILMATVHGYPVGTGASRNGPSSGRRPILQATTDSAVASPAKADCPLARRGPSPGMAPVSTG